MEGSKPGLTSAADPVFSAGDRVPIGVYRGNGCGMAKISAYESWLGRQVDKVLDFMPVSPGSWAEFEAITLDNNAGTAAGAWGQGVLGSRVLALGVPACTMNTSWSTEASGANDAHWTALGMNLVAAGLGNAVVRIGREFNGSWYPWKVQEGGQPAYQAGYAHIVEVLRAVPDSAFTIEWNPTLGVGNLTIKGTESCYPYADGATGADTVVDEIGLDVYDFGTISGTNIYTGNAATITTQQQQQVLDEFLTMWDSVRGWHNLARNHGKPLAFPEWGLVLWKTGSTYLGGGDNAMFVRGMADFINGCGASWHAFWEDPWGAGVSDPDTLPTRPIAAPMARAAFLRAFGG